MKRQSFLRAAGAALLAGHTGLSWGQTTGNHPIRVGFIGPLTGASTEMGTASRLGAELAISEINQAGGFLGRKFELVVRDDKANPDDGLRAAHDLVVNEKVDFTLGFRHLSSVLRGEPQDWLALWGDSQAAAGDWLARWQQRLTAQGEPAHEVAARMDATNPLFIPRNHLVENALDAASESGDLRPFERLLAIVTDPYTERTEDASAALPGTPEQTQGYRTFCGT